MKRKKVIAILLAAALSAGNLSGLGMLSVAAENTQTEQAMEKENEQTNIALNRTARASNSLGASAEHPARTPNWRLTEKGTTQQTISTAAGRAVMFRSFGRNGWKSTSETQQKFQR